MIEVVIPVSTDNGNWWYLIPQNLHNQFEAMLNAAMEEEKEGGLVATDAFDEKFRKYRIDLFCRTHRVYAEFI